MNENPVSEMFWFCVFAFGVAPAIAWLLGGGYWQVLMWLWLKLAFAGQGT